MYCRICLESTGELISPCACKGSSGYIHRDCLQKWVTVDKYNIRTHCEICREEFCRTEHFSCEMERYLHACFRFHLPDRERVLCQIVGLSLLLMLYLPIAHYVLISAVVSSSLGLVVFVHVCVYPKKTHLFLNYAIWIKLSFSFIFLVSCLVNYVSDEQVCQSICISIGKMCQDGCPGYSDFRRRRTLLDFACLFEVTTNIVLLVSRGCFLCSIYMRRSKYQNLNLAEENESLLSSMSADA